MFKREFSILVLALQIAACGGDSSSPSSSDHPLQLQISGDISLECLNEISIIDGYFDYGLDSGIDVTVTDLQLGEGGSPVRLDDLNLGNITISGRAKRPRGTITASAQSWTPSDPCAYTPLPDSIELKADGLPEHETGAFPNSENTHMIIEQDLIFSVTSNPQFASETTQLDPNRFDGVLNNGVPVKMRWDDCAEGSDCDLWHINPLYEPAWFGIDDHNGSVLAGGIYHYVGDPHTLYDNGAEAGLQVIGIAADGYLIFGPWFNDNGVIRKAISSYELKSGNYPGYSISPFDNPNQYYYPEVAPIRGEFIEDFEYVEGSGDLDECNGMYVDGYYGYFVTDDYPYMINCFKGTPDDSFLRSSD